jgi:ferredoxin
MAHVITDKCVKDYHCVDTCPTESIHPKADEPKNDTEPQVYIDPENCIDCGACIPVCPENAIFAGEELPEELKEFADKNAAFYQA